MPFEREIDNKEWHKIGDELASMFNICSCQRKLKTIVDNLYEIYMKLVDFQDNQTPLKFTGTEWLIIAMIDRNTPAIAHGINCEYPIIMRDEIFWKWIIEAKNNPNLEDN